MRPRVREECEARLRLDASDDVRMCDMLRAPHGPARKSCETGEVEDECDAWTSTTAAAAAAACDAEGALGMGLRA